MNTDSVFRPPNITLLNDKHWSYLRRRYHMSPRELQVARLVCRGLNNDEIAEVLEIRQGTVKTHLRNIYRRVRTRSKIALLLTLVDDVNGFHGDLKLGSSPHPISGKPPAAGPSSESP